MDRRCLPALAELADAVAGSDATEIPALADALDDPGELGLRREAAIALFRIAQEALANVCKHAEAKAVLIFLHMESDAFLLKIQDDGLGFDPAAASAARLGMKSMRERAEAAGGSLSVASAPGKGTTVEVSVPL